MKKLLATRKMENGIGNKFLKVYLFFVLVFQLIPFSLAPIPCYSAEKALFSPNDNIREELIARIDQTQKTLDLMLYNITDTKLVNALIKAKQREVLIRLIADETNAGDNRDKSLVFMLEQRGLMVKRLSGKKTGLMNNKVAIFDNRAVATGSFNWTRSANFLNYDNLVILEDRQMVDSFKREFERLWSR